MRGVELESINDCIFTLPVDNDKEQYCVICKNVHISDHRHNKAKENARSYEWETKGMIPRCKTCINRNSDGHCESPKLREGDPLRQNKDDELIYFYNEGGGFWVGELFGCVHYKEEVKI
jgi:hypothetical protein